MAKAKKRGGSRKVARGKKKAVRPRTVAKRKAPRKAAARKAAAAPAPRPIVIPGAWPFPMGPKP